MGFTRGAEMKWGCSLGSSLRRAYVRVRACLSEIALCGVLASVGFEAVKRGFSPFHVGRGPRERGRGGRGISFYFWLAQKEVLGKCHVHSKHNFFWSRGKMKKNSLWPEISAKQFLLQVCCHTQLDLSLVPLSSLSSVPTPVVLTGIPHWSCLWPKLAWNISCHVVVWFPSQFLWHLDLWTSSAPHVGCTAARIQISFWWHLKIQPLPVLCHLHTWVCPPFPLSVGRDCVQVQVVLFHLLLSGCGSCRISAGVLQDLQQFPQALFPVLPLAVHPRLE